MLPDITVLGPYTYLATEVVFGSLALFLLWRAGAIRRGATTVAALYPIAYVWDWYTLEVGVFDIVTRTGVDFLGIPIEEHVFMIVVPALVVGFHETIHGDGIGVGTEAGDPSEESGRTVRDDLSEEPGQAVRGDPDGPEREGDRSPDAGDD